MDTSESPGSDRVRIPDPTRSAPNDAALLRRLHDDDPTAWVEIVSRLLPRLRALARREGAIPDDTTCTIDLLTDLIGTWLDGSRPVPQHLDAYVLQAARFCHRQRRKRAERETQAQQTPTQAGDPLGPALSQFSAQQASGTFPEETTADAVDPDEARALIGRVVQRLQQNLAPDELTLMTWHAEGIARATIADWLGVSAEVVSKRLQRIRTRARIVVEQDVRGWPPHEQATWARLWRALKATPERAPRRPHSDPEGR